MPWGFRVLVTKWGDNPTLLGSGNPYGKSRPWVAICQDRFPPMHPDDDGLLPPIFGETKEEALNGLELTIQERVGAQGLESWSIVSVKDPRT